MTPISPKIPLSLPKKKKKILMTAVEVAPFASVGGLSQVMYYLPKALKAQGHDVRVFLPKFGLIDDKMLEEMNITMVHEGLKVPVREVPSKENNGENTANNGNHPTNGYHLVCNVKQAVIPETDVTVYFLENMEYYEMRANVYGYADDPIRWGLFQRGLLEFFKESIGTDHEWIPDILHCNDWQTGLVPNYLKTEYADIEEFSDITSVFTIHNLAHQGNFSWRDKSDAEYDDGKSAIPDSIFKPRFSNLNSMRRGIMYADAVNTVSRKYSREILTPEFGEGLNQLLVESRDKLFGILNGIDYDEFDPETDKKIEHNFAVRNVHKIRPKNKIALQEEFGIEQDESKIVLGVSYRLVGQKGVNLIADIMDVVLSEYPVQLVVNGDGDGYFKDKFREFQKKHPKKVGLNLASNFTLPRMIFAGADIMLLPSLFEPCGIVQMEAMRYGCVPIARAIGGLADTVNDGENGFTFDEFNALALFGAIVRAVEIYKHEKMWKDLVVNCMNKDFSWGASAKEYIEFYDNAQDLSEEEKSHKPNVLKFND